MNDTAKEDPKPDRGKGPPDGKGRPVDRGRPLPSHGSAATYSLKIIKTS